MTRTEAISLLTSSDQVKVSHRFLSSDEYVKSASIDGQIWLIDENGYQLSFSEFFQIRKGDYWEDDWYIKKD